jgi:hypothetical protein
VRFLAEQAGAYWLIDLIASHQRSAAARREPFQVWRLVLTPNRPRGFMARAEMGGDCRGTGQVLLHQNRAGQWLEGPAIVQRIPYTDFPLPDGIKLYLEDGVLCLPSER